MNVKFTRPASEEYLETVEYYNNLRDGLGYEFCIEFDSGIKKIIQYTEAWQELAPGIRRFLIRRFPYGIIYSVENDEILILSVMNLHKKPKKWDE